MIRGYGTGGLDRYVILVDVSKVFGPPDPVGPVVIKDYEGPIETGHGI